MRIVYFDVDSLRPDHLGCYGYVRKLSPSIDAVAARGLRFERCYASDAPCLPSRAALFTGQFGIRNGVTSHWGAAADLRPGSNAERPFLMLVLQRAGWRTACFSGFAQRHRAWWFSAGFTDFFGNKLPGGPESAEEVNALVLPWLREHGASDDWFLHVNYWDVHNPYEAPAEFVRRAADAPIGAHRPRGGAARPPDPSSEPGRRGHLRASVVVPPDRGAHRWHGVSGVPSAQVGSASRADPTRTARRRAGRSREPVTTRWPR